MSLASIIKHRRKEKGLTQMALAVAAGVSLPTIQNIEANKANPTMTLVNKIGKPLGIQLKTEYVEPDWNYLVEFGIPLSRMVSSEKKDRFQPMVFAKQLLLAVNFVSGGVKDEAYLRHRQALLALLLAIQRAYPTYFAYFLDQKKVYDFLKTDMPKGRLLKLSQIALAKVAHYI